MRKLFAILAVLLTVLPHPALFAAAVLTPRTCTPEAKMDCSCCAGDTCTCSVENRHQDPVPPQPAGPVRGADFYPVAAMPPREKTAVIPVVTVPERPAVFSRELRQWRGDGVPLFIRHRAFLI